MQNTTVFANSSGISLDSGLSMGWVALPVIISIVLIGAAIVIFIFMVFPAFFMKKNRLDRISFASMSGDK